MLIEFLKNVLGIIVSPFYKPVLCNSSDKHENLIVRNCLQKKTSHHCNGKHF